MSDRHGIVNPLQLPRFYLELPSSLEVCTPLAETQIALFLHQCLARHQPLQDLRSLPLPLWGHHQLLPEINCCITISLADDCLEVTMAVFLQPTQWYMEHLRQCLPSESYHITPITL